MTDGWFASRRQLLRNCPALEQVSAYAAEKGWELVSSEGDPALRENRRLAFDVSPELQVVYIEDFRSRQCFFYVTGTDEASASELITQTVEDLRPFSLEELLLQADNTEDRLPHARCLVLLGVAAPYEFDEEIYRRVVAIMDDPDPQVRLLSILATSYSPWPQYRPHYARLTQDPNPTIRQRASDVLEVMDEMGITE